LVWLFGRWEKLRRKRKRKKASIGFVRPYKESFVLEVLIFIAGLIRVSGTFFLSVLITDFSVILENYELIVMLCLGVQGNPTEMGNGLAAVNLLC
jgi:hypothetical protein